jgi:hypothetical protein
MSLSSKSTTRQGHFFRLIAMLGLVVSLLFAHEQAGSLFGKRAPAAGNRIMRSGYYLIDCDGDGNDTLHFVQPMPDSRYVYNEKYGWFDESHFKTGNPAQVIADVETAAANGGGIITISQPIREGITGYTAYYLISGDVAPEVTIEVALGIYMDWSVRFEQWQGSLPRSLVGPFTPFAIEDLPTQYIGFIEEAIGIERSALFACFLGPAKTANAPPHLWLREEPSTSVDSVGLPEVQRLTNRTFQPLVLTADGWEHISWPAPLRLNPLPSSQTTWIFDSEETWYLRQNIP